MLSDDELAQLRADMVELMPGTAVISRPTAAVANTGVVDETYAAQGTVICRLDPALQNDILRGVLHLGALESMKAYFTLTVPYNTDIAAGDRISIDSVAYELVRLYDTHSLKAVKRAHVARIEA